jgi:hypothetical protein
VLSCLCFGLLQLPSCAIPASRVLNPAGASCRALYTFVASIMSELRFLNKAVALVLGFVGELSPHHGNVCGPICTGSYAMDLRTPFGQMACCAQL